jgi:hypothetical protein
MGDGPKRHVFMGLAALIPKHQSTSVLYKLAPAASLTEVFFRTHEDRMLSKPDRERKCTSSHNLEHKNGK